MTTTSSSDTGSAADLRDPELRLRTLVDHGSLRPLVPRDESGVVYARGEVEGAPALAFATDATPL